MLKDVGIEVPKRIETRCSMQAKAGGDSITDIIEPLMEQVYSLPEKAYNICVWEFFAVTFVKANGYVGTVPTYNV